MSRAVYYATLTYAPRGDFAERVITPYHFQDAIRALRKRGHVLRYMGSGENGKRKTLRSHFHALLFFKDSDKKLPEFPNNDNFHDAFWPHGHIYGEWVTDNSHKACRYVAKYCVKEIGDKEEQSWFTLSKKPVLGYEWLEAQAFRYIDAGLLPTTFAYLPPGGKPKIQYLLSGAARRDFMQIIVTGLQDRGLLHAEDYMGRKQYSSASEWVKTALAKLERRDRQRALDEVWSEPYAHHVTVHRQQEGLKNRLDMSRKTDYQINTGIFLREGRDELYSQRMEGVDWMVDHEKDWERKA